MFEGIAQAGVSLGDPDAPGNADRVRRPSVPVLRGVRHGRAARGDRPVRALRATCASSCGCWPSSARTPSGPPGGARRRPAGPVVGLHRALLPQPGAGELRLRDRCVPPAARAADARARRRPAGRGLRQPGGGGADAAGRAARPGSSRWTVRRPSTSSGTAGSRSRSRSTPSARRSGADERTAAAHRRRGAGAGRTWSGGVSHLGPLRGPGSDLRGRLGRVREGPEFGLRRAGGGARGAARADRVRRDPGLAGAPGRRSAAFPVRCWRSPGSASARGSPTWSCSRSTRSASGASRAR